VGVRRPAPRRCRAHAAPPLSFRAWCNCPTLTLTLPLTLTLLRFADVVAAVNSLRDDFAGDSYHILLKCVAADRLRGALLRVARRGCSVVCRQELQLVLQRPVPRTPEQGHPGIRESPRDDGIVGLLFAAAVAVGSGTGCRRWWWQRRWWRWRRRISRHIYCWANATCVLRCV
jgi:hypothetical protein